jgi:hypothetical protein
MGAIVTRTSRDTWGDANTRAQVSQQALQRAQLRTSVELPRDPQSGRWMPRPPTLTPSSPSVRTPRLMGPQGVYQRADAQTWVRQPDEPGHA